MKPHAFCHRIAFTAILLSLFAGNAHAFDGRRNGFVIGLGVGGAYSLVSPPDLPGTRAEQNRFGPAGDVRIGCSWSRWSVFFDARFDGAGGISDLETGEDSYITIGMKGVGVAYFLNAERPGLFLLAVIERVHWNMSETSSTFDFWDMPHYMVDASGFGASLGAGWEFRRHWSIETSVLWGQVDGTYDHASYPYQHGEIDTTVSVLHLTLNYLFY